MILHKFICSNDHTFYLDLSLPQPIDNIAPLLNQLCCPVCQEKQVNIYAKSIDMNPK